MSTAEHPDNYIVTERWDHFGKSSYIALRLTCGHYTDPIYDRSSQWGFLHEPFICGTCGEERQVNLQVQAEVASGDWETE